MTSPKERRDFWPPCPDIDIEVLDGTSTYSQLAMIIAGPLYASCGWANDHERRAFNQFLYFLLQENVDVHPSDFVEERT